MRTTVMLSFWLQTQHKKSQLTLTRGLRYTTMHLDRHTVFYIYLPCGFSSGLKQGHATSSGYENCTSGVRLHIQASTVRDSCRDVGLTAGRARRDATPSAPRKSLRWIVACKPPSSQQLEKQRHHIHPQGPVFVTDWIEIQVLSVYL